LIWRCATLAIDCFALFRIESLPEDHSLRDVYGLLQQAMPVIRERSKNLKERFFEIGE
jgi:hypothetical protein